VSLHATKIFGIGEGGFILSTDPSVIQAVRLRLNLGLGSGRLETVAGLNAKLSEYHAAVGHASLDEWPAVRAEWLELAGLYRRALAGAGGPQLQTGFGESWVSSSLVVDTGLPDTTVAFEATLAAHGIETRRWWEYGAHAHPTTRDTVRTPLPVTERLAHSTVGLPFYRGLTGSDVERVVQTCLAASQEL
jgi:dTDP-4-amino-4,6-dideoxygalactose transaminase